MKNNNTVKGFTRGFCRVLDLGAKNKGVLNITVRRNDYDALMKDWENVGKNITTAVSKYSARECR